MTGNARTGRAWILRRGVTTFAPVYCLCCAATVPDPEALEREGSRCAACGAISRDRYMALGVLAGLGLIARRPGDRDAVAMGISDSLALSVALTRTFGGRYRNHQIHEEPFLDLCAVPASLRASADLVTCSDVLEHVPNPVGRAFAGLFDLLAPGGVAVLSVPHTLDEDHVEHFPVMPDARLEPVGGDYVYRGTDEHGAGREFHDLVFHGGRGETLEHRLFSSASFARHLGEAGFQEVHPLRRNFAALGASWEPWSRVWLAVKP